MPAHSKTHKSAKQAAAKWHSLLAKKVAQTEQEQEYNSSQSKNQNTIQQAQTRQPAASIAQSQQQQQQQQMSRSMVGQADVAPQNLSPPGAFQNRDDQHDVSFSQQKQPNPGKSQVQAQPQMQQQQQQQVSSTIKNTTDTPALQGGSKKGTESEIPQNNRSVVTQNVSQLQQQQQNSQSVAQSRFGPATESSVSQQQFSDKKTAQQPGNTSSSQSQQQEPLSQYGSNKNRGGAVTDQQKPVPFRDTFGEAPNAAQKKATTAAEDAEAQRRAEELKQRRRTPPKDKLFQAPTSKKSSRDVSEIQSQGSVSQVLDDQQQSFQVPNNNINKIPKNDAQLKPKAESPQTQQPDNQLTQKPDRQATAQRSDRQQSESSGQVMNSVVQREESADAKSRNESESQLSTDRRNTNTKVPNFLGKMNSVREKKFQPPK